MDESPGEMRSNDNAPGASDDDPAAEELSSADPVERYESAILAEIDDTRSEMAETIAAIERRLAPARIEARVREQVREATIGRVEQAAKRAGAAAIEAVHQARQTASGQFALSKATFAGQPLHPQLVPLPAALLPFSFALDLLYLTTGNRAYATAAFYSLAGGCIAGIPAALAGAGDFLALPAGEPAKKIASVHASLNLGLAAMAGVDLLLRRGKQPPTATLPIVLSGLGTAALAVSTWLGRNLVYGHGLGVKK